MVSLDKAHVGLSKLAIGVKRPEIHEMLSTAHNGIVAFVAIRATK